MAISIERADAGDVDSLRELWLQLHHHHQEVGPQSGTFTDDESSWAVRSANYREWLAEEGYGVGGRLLDEMDAELERLGIDEVFVGLIPGNDGAQRLYESRGFKGRWLTLVRSR